MSLNTVKLGDIKQSVKRQFGDESGYQLDDSDIVRWANLAQMEIVSKNKVLRATTVLFNSAEGIPLYEKPDDTLQVNSCQYKGLLLASVGLDEFISKGYRIDGQPNKDTETTEWTQMAGNIYVNGKPSHSEGLTIVYVPEPTELTVDSDVISVPDRYYNRILEFILSKAYEMDEDWNGHQVQRQMFEDNLVSLSNEESDTYGPYPVVQDYEY